MSETLRLNGRLINVGDTMNAVRRQAGEPDRTDRYTNRGYTITVWYYDRGNLSHEVKFRGSKVSGLTTEFLH